MRTLVLGGIRSGKSRWAEDTITQALQSDQPVRYLAPGPPGEADPEWLQRISRHRNRRPAHWTTVETDDVAAELRRSPDAPALVDDLGTWLTGTLDRQGWQDGSVTEPVADLASAVSAFESTLVLVSPEVGLTVVPATAAGRRFADELGTLNQRMAALCERVVLVVAGQALTIKAPA
ncbi:bifunctional adenosylcobinamide kinase/adenosylcobinamide-phosphate guanylyltransferase [Mycobacterium asiaticum]|uniref:Adenosylcobinamide kinase n=1 Tax=Mycobacterium asiaticum TaxID=1790 RepID=A0A1A3CR57_MYCAS|nr:bifunctional adenosylcobinamide kinase/adenosylcobinamide-phosphate guanylyltransferase [Mycobacterium asiaticum]OBI88847.1 adenosylcobinamide kinase/adenosylcobinamide phosphate guanyltransferase [Mycobacterium asiaticum]